MIKHNLLIADGEFLYDPVANKAVAVDLGEACHLNETDIVSTDRQINEATLVLDTFVRFCPPYTRQPTVNNIASKLVAGGIASLDTLLYEHAKTQSG